MYGQPGTGFSPNPVAHVHEDGFEGVRVHAPLIGRDGFLEVIDEVFVDAFILWISKRNFQIFELVQD